MWDTNEQFTENLQQYTGLIIMRCNVLHQGKPPCKKIRKKVPFLPNLTNLDTSALSDWTVSSFSMSNQLPALLGTSFRVTYETQPDYLILKFIDIQKEIYGRALRIRFCKKKDPSFVFRSETIFFVNRANLDEK